MSYAPVLESDEEGTNNRSWGINNIRVPRAAASSFTTMTSWTLTGRCVDSQNCDRSLHAYEWLNIGVELFRESRSFIRDKIGHAPTPVMFVRTPQQKLYWLIFEVVTIVIVLAPPDYVSKPRYCFFGVVA